MIYLIQSRLKGVNSVFIRLLFLLVISFSYPSSVNADTSPEFYQLLGEINAQLKTFTPTRGPQCTPDLIDKVQNALQGEMFTSALNTVVVAPLETGAKAGLSILGVPAAAITTYSIMRCAMKESDTTGFIRCTLGEAIGYRAGEVIGAAGADEITGALSGVVMDQAYGEARGAYEAYQASSEVVEGESESDCKVKYRISWYKRGLPDAKGGKVHFQAWVSDCDCNSRSQAKSGYVSVWFKVKYARAGSSQPGWKLNTFEKLHIEAQCCGQSGAARSKVYLFNPQGLIVRDDPPPVSVPPETGTTTGGGQTETGSGSDDGGTSTSTPPTPQPPPPVILPAPEQVEYTRANPCPPCQPISDKIDEVARDLSRLFDERSGKLGEKNQKLDDKRNLERQISRLESRLRGEAGVGGESTDQFGTTTSSYDMGDGRVRIRVTDSEGNVISETFKQRESTADVQARLEAKKAELMQTETDIERIEKEIIDIDAQRDELKNRYDNLQSALDDCVASMCGKFATCEQLLKHIKAYESAGLQIRSRSVINNLKRRAREMGCYDIEENMISLVNENYDLTGNFVFKTTVPDDFHSVLDELISIEEDETEEGKATNNEETGTSHHSVLNEISSTGLTSQQVKQIRTKCKQCEQLTLRINRVSKERERLKDRIQELDDLVFKLEAGVNIAKKVAWNTVGYNQSVIQIIGILNKIVVVLDEEPGDGYDLGGNNGEIAVSKDNVLAESYRKIAQLKDKLKALKKDIDEKNKLINELTVALIECEKQCVSINIIDVISITGNPPYDPRDPISEDGNTESVATVKVINNIPVSRLTLAGADVGCPNPNGNHYHGSSAKNCNGVVTADPAPGACGHGRVSEVKTIPVTSCPDL